MNALPRKLRWPVRVEGRAAVLGATLAPFSVFVPPVPAVPSRAIRAHCGAVDPLGVWRRKRSLRSASRKHLEAARALPPKELGTKPAEKSQCSRLGCSLLGLFLVVPGGGTRNLRFPIFLVIGALRGLDLLRIVGAVTGLTLGMRHSPGLDLLWGHDFVRRFGWSMVFAAALPKQRESSFKCSSVAGSLRRPRATSTAVPLFVFASFFFMVVLLVNCRRAAGVEPAQHHGAQPARRRPVPAG